MKKFEILKLLEEAESRSNCLKRKVGAVILTKKRSYIGYNKVQRNKYKKICAMCLKGNKITEMCPAIHAEIKTLVTGPLADDTFTDSFMLISYSPCPECCKAIIAAGIAKVTVKEPRNKFPNLLTRAVHDIETYDELAEKLLTDVGIKYIKLWEYETEQEVI